MHFFINIKSLFLNILNKKQAFIKILLVLTLFTFFSANAFSEEIDIDDNNDTVFISGKVVEIISEAENKMLAESFAGEQISQIVKVLILSGENKGKTVEIENQLTSNPIYDINIKPGMRVVIAAESIADKEFYYITDIERYPILLMTIGIFFFLLMLIGGKKGLWALFSLITTALMIFFILIPAILNGFPIMPTAIVISLLATIITMFIVGGKTLKSVSASIGTIISVSAAGILSSFVIKAAPLTGFHDQESAMLFMNRPDLNFTEILTAGIIIGALGAVMDVGMSIASSITELKAVNNNLCTKELFKSGLNVGRDIMGTMANTLILAYIGGAFSLALIAANAPIVKLLNLNSIATEITAAVTGSIGIVLCVPITAAITAWLVGKSCASSQQPAFEKIGELQDKIEV